MKIKPNRNWIEKLNCLCVVLWKNNGKKFKFVLLRKHKGKDDVEAKRKSFKKVGKLNFVKKFKKVLKLEMPTFNKIS